MLVEQGLARLHERIVQSEYLARPRRRAQGDDLFFQRLQPGKPRRVVAIIDHRGSKRRRGSQTMRRKIGEHPEYLTGVAPERLDKKPVGHSTVPLGAVLPR